MRATQHLPAELKMSYTHLGISKMSLYNMVFGYNPLAAALLGMLKVKHEDIPRFRDCFLNKDGTEIIIHTRTGGGNRKEYQSQNDAMAFIKGYNRDEDSNFDNTYANFYYEVPEQYRFMIPALKDMVSSKAPEERWQELFKSLENGDKGDS
jgi:hypothetical protein